MTTPGFTGYKANVAPVDSGGTITFTQNDTRRIGVTKSSINFSGYKYLKMNVYGQKNHYGVTSVGAESLITRVTTLVNNRVVCLNCQIKHGHWLRYR